MNNLLTKNLLTNKMSLLTGIKDIDLKIFSELDDISLLNFCRQNEKDPYINKLCFDEHFWRNRFISKYEFINKDVSHNKNPTRTWRNFYLKITYYDEKYTPDRAMDELAKGGIKNLDLINFFIDMGAKDWDTGMIGAAEGGHIDLVQFFINKGANEWNWGMYGAAKGGNMEVIQFFRDKGADDWDDGMSGAANGGHMDLVKFFINRGANMWNYGMYSAAEGGHMDLVNFFIHKGANNWNHGMRGAARSGHMDLVKFFIGKGAREWNCGLKGAIKGGQLDLIQFFIDKDLTKRTQGEMIILYLKELMETAERYGYKEIINFFKNKIEMFEQ